MILNGWKTCDKSKSGITKTRFNTWKNQNKHRLRNMNATKVQLKYDWHHMVIRINCVQNSSAFKHLILFFLNRIFKIYTVNLWYIIITLAWKDCINNRQNKKITVNLNIGFRKKTFFGYWQWWLWLTSGDIHKYINYIK